MKTKNRFLGVVFFSFEIEAEKKKNPGNFGSCLEVPHQRNTTSGNLDGLSRGATSNLPSLFSIFFVQHFEIKGFLDMDGKGNGI